MNELQKEGKGIISHDRVKIQILSACDALGLQAKEEYRGKDWRADVFVAANGVNYAFEVQTTRQSLNKTLERQEKYQRDGIIGCWLFEKEPTKLEGELQYLPLFKLSHIDGQVHVSLKERKKLPLDIFISDYLQNKIKFCKKLRLPKAEIRFIKQPCWKCGFEYYIYYVGGFISPCNAEIFEHEAMWGSEKMIFMPEIMVKVNEYVSSAKEKNLNVGTIKERFSKTIDKSYLSFGCPECDSIFGDWFLHEIIMETFYGDGIEDKILIEGNFDKYLEASIPHWCHPGQNKFCE
jgi:hypothetical protein